MVVSQLHGPTWSPLFLVCDRSGENFGPVRIALLLASMGTPWRFRTRGPFQDFYHRMLERGMREELARVTLARNESNQGAECQPQDGFVSSRGGARS